MAKESKKMIEPKIKEEQVSKTHNYETIFTIVEQNGNFRIAVANKLISRMNFVTLEEAQSYIDSKPWELIINATCAIYEISLTIKK